MSRLRLRVLGWPEAYHGERLLGFRTRKTLALLLYLAIEPGRHSRERLTALFWPDQTAEPGRAMLRNTLLYLRQALDGGEADHLAVDRAAISLVRTAEYDLDFATLQAAAVAARRAPPAAAAPARQRLLIDLQQAAQAYQGSFCAGFTLGDTAEFDDWVRLQQEVGARCLSSILERLTQLQVEAGDLAGARDTALRWAAHDPLAENAQHCLMQMAFAAGDRAAALQTYERYRALLAHELHARPTPALETLAARVRAMTLRGPGTVRAARPPDGIDGPVAFTLPLVGRAPLYAQLMETYQQVQEGSTRLVLLTGEAGIGKTRLATDFLGWAAAQGADIVQSRAFETAGGVPYQPVVAALRPRIEQENAPDDLVDDVWLAELSRLFPELRERYPDLPPASPDETTAQVRLLEAVARLLGALAMQTPVVLFLDDLQWADSASLDLVQYLGRWGQKAGSRIFLLLSLRAEGIATRPAVAHWLATLTQDLAAVQQPLRPLTQTDVEQLVARFLAGDGPPAAQTVFSRWLFAETKGQPFYAHALLTLLVEQGLLAARWDTAGQWTLIWGAAARTATLPWEQPATLLPRSVRAMIQTRLQHLSRPAFALAIAAATLGHDFSFAALVRVASLAEEAALAALDELLAQGILREGWEAPGGGPGSAGIAPGRYFFTHDKIRDVVYTEAGEARRRVLHGRALAVLEAAGAAPADLARHALAAGLPGPAFRHSLAAGDAALRLFAVRDALSHYEQARRLLATAGAFGEPPGFPAADLPSPAALRQLYSQLGRAYELVNEWDRAESVYTEMLAQSEANQNTALECAALNRLADLAIQGLEARDPLALLHQARRAALVSGDPADLAETEWTLAHLHFVRRDAVTALTHGEQALVLARRHKLADLEARSLNMVAYAATDLGQWTDAEAWAGAAAAAYAALGNRVMEADSLGQVASARLHRGDPRGGVQAALTARMISQEIGNTWGQVSSGLFLAQSYLENGEYQHALDVATASVDLARRQGLAPSLLIFSLARLGAAQRAVLCGAEACATHQEALALSQAPDLHWWFREMVAAELCADYVLTEEWAAAAEYATVALRANNGTVPFAVLSYGQVIEALAHSGRQAQAVSSVAQLGAQWNENPRYEIAYLQAQAALALSQAAPAQALERFQAALQIAEHLGLPGEQWQLAARVGACYQAQGQQQQAATAITAATTRVRHLAETISDRPLRDRFLQRALARCQVWSDELQTRGGV